MCTNCQKFVFFLSTCFFICSTHGLTTIKEWNLLTYDFPHDWPVNNDSLYNPYQIVLTGIEVANGFLYLSTPRIFSGVPSTLSKIKLLDNTVSPVLQAYPNWEAHDAGMLKYDCKSHGLVSVYRTRMDSCGRLWVLDAGVVRSLEDYEVVCPPKIMIYDVATDNLIYRIDVPKEVLKERSLLTNLVLDGHCDDLFVYISDTVAPGLIVYRLHDHGLWRFEDQSMFPNETFYESTIDGYKFQLMDGIVGLAHDPTTEALYFQPVATNKIYKLNTRDLKNGPNSDLQVTVIGQKSSQGLGLSTIGNHILFSPFTETLIASYNPITGAQGLVAHDSIRLQFVSDMIVRTNKFGYNNLFVLSSKFHRFLLKNVNKNEKNIRIMVMQV